MSDYSNRSKGMYRNNVRATAGGGSSGGLGFTRPDLDYDPTEGDSLSSRDYDAAKKYVQELDAASKEAGISDTHRCRLQREGLAFLGTLPETDRSRMIRELLDQNLTLRLTGMSVTLEGKL